MNTNMVVFVALCAVSLAACMVHRVPRTGTAASATAPAVPSVATPKGYPPLDPTGIYRQMGLEYLVRAYADLHPEAASMALYNAYLAEGSTEQNIGIMETSVDSRQIVLTADSEAIYAVHPVNLKGQGGAVVLQVPPRMLGMANAPGWVDITDIGTLGPDKGKGGHYLFTAPDYQGATPAGYFHFKSPTNTIIWLLRGFVENGDTKATVRFMQQNIRTYPLSTAKNPPTTTFYNTSESRTLGHPMDMLYKKENVFALIRQFFDLNGPGPVYLKHRDIYSHLYDIGFFAGAVDPALLEKAAVIGDERLRTLTFNNRAPDAVKWLGRSRWQWANNFSDERFAGRRSRFYSASQHQAWSYQATFNAVGMARSPKGTGSQYVMATKDRGGQWLAGGKHYTLTVPPKPPAKDLWSIILYDADQRSMIRNAELRWGVNSDAKDIKYEADGSVILHFSPTQPAGVNRRNWIQTNPGEGYFVWFRTYGPTDAWYDNSWVLPDIEAVK